MDFDENKSNSSKRGNNRSAGEDLEKLLNLLENMVDDKQNKKKTKADKYF